jgi:hypothetical protein
MAWHLKVDVKVQQKLLRHADIRTTLNVYTQGVSESLRTANDLVVFGSAYWVHSVRVATLNGPSRKLND